MTVWYFSFTFPSDSQETSVKLLQMSVNLKGSSVMLFGVICLGPWGSMVRALLLLLHGW